MIDIGRCMQQDAAGVVNLFLHEVKENRELREPGPVLRKVGSTFVKQRPPLRVDCSYIVTTWKEPTDEVSANLTHQLLGQALIWLSRFPTIPETYLQGDLKRSADDPLPTHQPVPLPTMVAQVDPNKNSGEFWSALGIPPRPYFTLTVTIAMDLAQPAGGMLVTTRHIDAESASGEPADRKRDTLIQIGGQVIDSAGTGISGVRVDLVEIGAHTITGDDGRYTFPSVPAQVHTLRATATGFAVTEQAITVPGESTDYVLQLAAI